MDTAKDVVRRLIDDGGTLLLKCADVLTAEEFFHQPSIGASMAWTLGHLAAFQDWSMSNVDPGQQRILTSETREFLRGGKVVSSEEMQMHFQSNSALKNLFATTQARSIATLNSFDISRWREPTPTGCRYPTHGAVWESIAYENYWHLGQISVCVPRIQGTHMAIPVPRPYKLPFAPT